MGWLSTLTRMRPTAHSLGGYNARMRAGPFFALSQRDVRLATKLTVRVVEGRVLQARIAPVTRRRASEALTMRRPASLKSL